MPWFCDSCGEVPRNVYEESTVICVEIAFYESDDHDLTNPDYPDGLEPIDTSDPSGPLCNWCGNSVDWMDDEEYEEMVQKQKEEEKNRQLELFEEVEGL